MVDRLLRSDELVQGNVGNETKLDALFEALDTMPEAIAVFDPEDRLVYCSRKYHEIYGGLDEFFVRGTTFEDVSRAVVLRGIVRLNGTSVEEYISKRLEEHRSGVGITEHQLYDGRWIRATDTRTQDGYFISKRVDISAERKARLDLAESESRLRAFAESASDYFWEMDADLRFSYFSSRFTEVTGVPADDLLGKRREESGLETQIDPVVLKAHLADLVAHRPFRNFVHPRTKPDGSFVWLSVSGIPVFHGLGTFQGYRGTGQDITESVAASEALRRERNMFTGAMENTTDGFALFDAEDRLVFCNSSFKKLNPDLAPNIWSGVTFEEMLRDNVAHGRINEARGREEAYIEERLASHRNPAGEGMLSSRQDGRWLMQREQRMPDGSTFLVQTDLTTLKQREQALEIEKERAETANKAKSDFLANMSHELRTPLNAIIGFSEILAQQDDAFAMDDKKRAEYAANIRDAGHHLISLINDILDMSKIEAGEYSLDRTQVSLGNILGSAADLMMPRAATGEIDLEVKIRRDLPLMLADERAVRQMVLNLLSNAIKFTGPGGRVAAAAGLDLRGFFIQVEDDGIGMSQEILEKATEPFVQGSPLSFSEPGTGLGLAITKRLAEIHGATLEIESSLGRGTTVTIVFPRED